MTSPDEPPVSTSTIRAEPGGAGRQQDPQDRGEAQVDRPLDVPADLIAPIVEVLHPEQVWLFGSRARGEARAESDWDFMAILADDAPAGDHEQARAITAARRAACPR